MSDELEIFKKKLLYRASYRGTKEMDILLSSFVKKYINTFKKKELEEYVETPGFVKTTSDLIKISKFMVMPSILPEGCPTSIIEGMASGKPAIGYNIEGLKELIKNNKTV